MRIKAWMLSILLITLTSAYAAETDTVSQGAQQYDWQTCVDAKYNECLENCSSSSDPDCNNNCNSLAQDKCVSSGFTPPPQ